MNVEAFVDTDILVSLYDAASPEKQRKALALADELVRARTGVISSQVLDEFFVAVTRKISRPLSPREALRRIQSLLNSWRVVGVTPPMVREAARGVVEHKMKLWDAQIWATAKLSEIPVVFSENFPSGRSLEGVQFLNPFLKDFHWS
ncbi:MAG: PIN domain-containing protein [Acidobacteriia bacterium]|nr:PIN domain-containing protein [Terriglobia bacterium]